MVTVSNASGAAIRVYDTVVHDQIFNDNVLWNNILKNVGKLSGKDASTKYLTVHYGRNVGYAAGTDSLTLPLAGKQTNIQATVSMTNHYQTISITDKALVASNRSNEFLVNLLDDEYKRAKQDMQRQLSRQGYGVGTGVVCRVNDASPDTTLTFDTPMTGKHPISEYFDIGNGIMFSSAADAATSAAYTTVTAITGDDTATITLATGVADNDYVYFAHPLSTAPTVPTVSNVNAEVMGLKGLIDDTSNLTTLQGLSRDTYLWWKSSVDSAASQRSLTENLMHSTFQKGKKLGKIKYGLTHPDVLVAYGQLLSADRRYTKDMMLNGGFSGVEFNGVPLVDDNDCPYDELYWIDPTSLSVEDLAPISFLDADGDILNRIGETPVFGAVMRYYVNIATSACNKNSVLRDVVQ